jgi:hypothetical protein
VRASCPVCLFNARVSIFSRNHHNFTSTKCKLLNIRLHIFRNFPRIYRQFTRTKNKPQKKNVWNVTKKLSRISVIYPHFNSSCVVVQLDSATQTQNSEIWIRDESKSTHKTDRNSPTRGIHESEIERGWEKWFSKWKCRMKESWVWVSWKYTWENDTAWVNITFAARNLIKWNDELNNTTYM